MLLIELPEIPFPPGYVWPRVTSKGDVLGYFPAFCGHFELRPVRESHQEPEGDPVTVILHQGHYLGDENRVMSTDMEVNIVANGFMHEIKQPVPDS
jgi:hypothetical protein